MQTQLPNSILHTLSGQRIDSILRTCVHCGFCNSACPTYNITNNELDGPRGRIYLIKRALEKHSATNRTLKHIDQCLTCMGCATACPSGVDYLPLLNYGRHHLESVISRSLAEKIKRTFICGTVPFPNRIRLILHFINILQTTFPFLFTTKLPKPKIKKRAVENSFDDNVLLLQGCVQSVLEPDINTCAAKLLQKLKLNVVELNDTACCGALSYHLGHYKQAQRLIKHNIDKWWNTVEAKRTVSLIATSSGCCSFIQQYGEILNDDKEYHQKACAIAKMAQDISSIIKNRQYSAEKSKHFSKIAFHSPCTLQHHMKIASHPALILKEAGYTLLPVTDPDLCCGSAGAYSLLEKEFANELLKRKIDGLMANQPQAIATANIGCLLHLRKKSPVPVFHWLELVTH